MATVKTQFNVETSGTSISLRLLQRTLFVPVLVLLLLGQSSAAEWWQNPPRGQPDQMWSQVDYDPKLNDPFFKSKAWSYRSGIVAREDGHFEDASTGMTTTKEPPRLKHTAKCFSTSMGTEHLLRFCEARMLDANTIDLVIYEENPADTEALRVQLKNGTFTSQYKYLYKMFLAAACIWTTKKQKLTLDKKTYRKGDVIKGRIDFECQEEKTNPRYIDLYGQTTATIRVNGVFRTTVK